MLTEAIGWPFEPGSSVGFLLDCALKGGLLLLTVGLLLGVALRRATAAARYALCVAAAGGLLALPAVAALTPRWSLPLPERWARLLDSGTREAAPEPSPLDLFPRVITLSPPFVPVDEDPADRLPAFPPFAEGGTRDRSRSAGLFEDAATAFQSAPATGDPLPVTTGETAPTGVEEKAPPAPDRFAFEWPSTPTLVMVLWLSGAALAFLPWLVGLRALRGLLRRSRRIEDGVAVEQLEALCRELGCATPRLYETARALMPMAGTLFGPFILLPPGASAWSGAKLRNVLTHEMGHIARRDDLAYLAARLAAALHWFNPFVWALLRVLRYERERACDDLVLRQGAASCDYATHLVEILKTASSVHPAMLAATPMACPRRLEKRIVAILDDHLNRKGLTMRNRITMLAAVTALTLFLGGATVTRNVETKEAQKENALQPSTGTQTETVVTRRVETKETPKRIPLQPPTKALTETAITLKEVLVPAKPDTSGPWVCAGFRLRSGKVQDGHILFFEVEGAASHREGVAPYSPNGDSNMGLAKKWESDSVKYLCSEANVGALVGKIGEKGTPFLIGEKGAPFLIGERRAVRIWEDGVLYLGFNDAYGSTDDNTGSFKVYIGSDGRGEPTPLQKCLKNRLLIREAKAEWAKTHNKQPADTPTWEDLVGPDKPLKEKPVCPEGGEYSLAGTEPEVTCSKHAETRWVAAEPAQPTTPNTATPAVGHPTASAPQEYTLPEGHVSAFGKDYQYAFLSGDGAGYKAPDYDGFFPDDEEAGKKLDEMFGKDKFNAESRVKWMDPDDLWRTVRQGWKRCTSGRIPARLLLDWNSTENPDATEIYYHLSGMKEMRSDSFSKYRFPPLKPRIPSAILRSFVDFSLKPPRKIRESAVVNMMKYDGREQSDEILEYIEPYLESDNPSVVEQAKELRQKFDRKKWLEGSLREWEKGQQAFLKGSEEQRRRMILDRNITGFPEMFVGRQTVTDDSRYLDLLAQYANDPDPSFRRSVAVAICYPYIHGRSVDENPRAIQIVLEMLADQEKDHLLIYSVLPSLVSVRNKPEQVVRAILNHIYVWRNEDYCDTAERLGEDRVVVRKLLEADLADFQNDPLKALYAFEVYGDILREPLASTPDWVAGITTLSGMKEAVFWLKARDPKVQTDLNAFRTTVRETLLQNKERGERWLQQFYLDRNGKTWNAVIFVPAQDRYLFWNFIQSCGTLLREDDFHVSDTYVSPDSKARYLKDLRTPDMQLVEKVEIIPASAGETISPLPVEVLAAWERKKGEEIACRQARNKQEIGERAPERPKGGG